jgi:hypothetical protein
MYNIGSESRKKTNHFAFDGWPLALPLIPPVVFALTVEHVC